MHVADWSWTFETIQGQICTYLYREQSLPPTVLAQLMMQLFVPNDWYRSKLAIAYLQASSFIPLFLT